MGDGRLWSTKVEKEVLDKLMLNDNSATFEPVHDIVLDEQPVAISHKEYDDFDGLD